MAKLTAGPNALKISKAQQLTILEVLIASLLVGCALVLSVWLVRYIMFNAEVISAKDESLKNYENTVLNLGVCADTNGDGGLSDSELKSCDPDSVKISTIPKTLRYNVLVNMANSSTLESVQRTMNSSCYDSDGNLNNYLARYEASGDYQERAYYLSLYQTCSTLRVVPDALPSAYNVEAAMSSLNYLFDQADISPESMTPESYSTATSFGTDNLLQTGIRFTVETTEKSIMDMLQTMEKSIRTYNFSTISIDVNSSDDRLEFAGTVYAYYVENSEFVESTKTVTNKGSTKK